tara:strand:- start:594 stop:926 length:333 start_codon:yes stop_codon:yes gene_type:complete
MTLADYDRIVAYDYLSFPLIPSYPESFIDFHRANPHVYDRIVELTFRRKDAGWKRGSMKQIFEVIRWEYDLKTTGDFKLNNNYTAWYARLVMERNPSLDGFFQLRKAKAA